jgi:capsular polysaccharide biosynthesis protein
MNRTGVRNLYRRALRWPFLAYGVLPLVRRASTLLKRTKLKGSKAAVVADAAASFPEEALFDLPPCVSFFPPSNAESVQVGEYIWNGRRIIRQFYESANNASVKRGKDYYAGPLYGCLRHESPATFSMRVPDGVFDSTSGFAIRPSGEVLAESCASRLREEDLYRLGSLDLRQAVKLDGAWLCLMHPWATNYAHWVTEFLQRAILARRHGFVGKVAIRRGSPKFVRESLEMLGFQSNDVAELDEGLYRAGELTVASASRFGNVPRIEYLAELRERLISAAGGDASTRRRIYISREGAERAVVNESELVPILDKRGFQILKAEELSFADQVRLFSGCDVLVGPHGAGVFNALFMRRDGLVLEILNEARYDLLPKRMVQTLGIEHWHVHAKNLDFATWPTHVDPRGFEVTLDMALERLELGRQGPPEGP